MPDRTESPPRESPPSPLVVAALVFLLAFVIRVGYLFEIRDIGFVHHSLSDARVYEDAARRIAAGEWLGPPDFVHAPLYAYVLAFLRCVGLDGPWPPRGLQAVAGATACVLTLLAGRRLFDETVARTAATVLALFPAAIFFDGLIQKTSLELLLSALLVFLVARCFADRGRPLVIGVALGLFALCRQHAVVLLPILLGVVWQTSPRGSVGARRAAICTLGMLLTLAPWIARNRVVLGEFVLATPNLGQNFAMGNNPKATGTYLPFRRGRATGELEQREWTRYAEQQTGRRLSPGEVSDFYLRAALRWIKSHPGEWFRLSARKLLMVFDAKERMDTEDYYLFRERSWVLTVLDTGLPFSALSALAALGLVASRRRWRTLWWLGAWIAAGALAIAAFVVFGRYRAVLFAPITLFAGAGVVWVARRLIAGEYGRASAAIACALLVGAACHVPVRGERQTDAVSYTNHALALAGAGRFGAAVSECQKALRLRPNDADVLYALGRVHMQSGRLPLAAFRFARAAACDPTYAAPRVGRGDALRTLGRYDEAEAEYDAALRCEPGDVAARCGLATLLALKGHYDEAIARFEDVLRDDESSAETWLNLGNAYLAKRRFDDAARAIDRALALRPDFADALHNRGILEALRGRPGNAADWFRRALRLQPDRADSRDALRALEAPAGGP